MSPLLSFRARRRGRGILLFLSVFLCVLCVFAVSPSASAQCAMCYTTAAAAGAAAARSIDYGILILLTPALLLFISIFVLLIRRAAAVPFATSTPQ